MSPNPTPEKLQDVKVERRYVNGLKDLQLAIFTQANHLFPNRTPSKAFMKLYEEMGEVIKKPTDRLEWADVIILILDLAKIYGVTDLQEAVIEKMAINQNRTWVETATGTMQHTIEDKAV